ncbi:hypothetical protein OV079_13015 [Nannocystis pusilla]|uniref:Uncharacterized protein n=1 Tax=Nannocystis pusilla TaxID=889268 RepID=A0A9X3IY36_9BACT|nr:hypothetical protein [Nannocystis pusilla]MCY1006463.1 hypothetical protein [Nannocystis pusilla]
MSSPIGAIKDAIVEYDRTHEKLFANNIEVTSNTNDKHTLMTMSVFVASIGEMFSSEEIKNARADDELKEDLAEYYCNFSYELSKSLVVRCDLDGTGTEVDVHPFDNLYVQLIKAVEDRYDENNPARYEQDLDAVQKEAVRRNKALRRVDITNNNATIKALYRLGGQVRRMPNWPTVIRRLQTALIVPAGGKFFQKENPDLFAKASDSDIPIASLNEDGAINVQVQTKNINKLYNYLLSKLGLALPPTVVVMNDNDETELSGLRANVSLELDKQSETVLSVELRFIGVAGSLVNEADLALAIIPSIEWKEATRKAAKQLSPLSVYQDKSYGDQFYEDLVRWVATFEVKVPKASKLKSEEFEFSFRFSYPSINMLREKIVAKISARVV